MMSIVGHAKTDENTSAPKDSVQENQFTMGAQVLSRGELRQGGLPVNEKDDDLAAFFMERSRLTFDYSRPHLEIKIVPQHSGVWGQAGKGAFNLYESWIQLQARNGLFAKVGRQELSYDNERIIGANDWAMAAASHDVIKLGYEGHGHKAHFILGFNQNAENTHGGTYYENGAQPYKSLQTLWYHYDVPRTNFGASVIFMNIGAQNTQTRKTNFQQLVGAYLLYTPSRWLFEGSYYYQFGTNEIDMTISAWMASLKAQYSFHKQFRATAGYDYLSGDEFYYVRNQGQIGLIHHEKIKGFNTLYGSHHQFYGAMDFFYMSAYTDGFTPGLQNLYFGLDYTPIKNLKINAYYHYLSTATALRFHDRNLGHELELSASYRFMPDVSLSAGYSYMIGSETMEALKRANDEGRLSWAWLSLNVSPRLFTKKW